MPGDWYTLWQTQAHGLTAAEGVARFVAMFWDESRGWKWADEPQGVFTVTHGSSLYRVRKSVANGMWVFEWLSRGL